MKCLYSNVACSGMDVHYKFSNVTFRDSAGNVVRRERLEHPQRDQLRARIARWHGLPARENTAKHAPSRRWDGRATLVCKEFLF